MKFPKKCPNCGVVFGDPPDAYLFIRTELDFDADEPDRIEDQIYECSNCHTLFRARWKLVDFVQLKKKVKRNERERKGFETDL